MAAEPKYVHVNVLGSNEARFRCACEKCQKKRKTKRRSEQLRLAMYDNHVGDLNSAKEGDRGPAAVRTHGRGA